MEELTDIELEVEIVAVLRDPEHLGVSCPAISGARNRQPQIRLACCISKRGYRAMDRYRI